MQLKQIQKRVLSGFSLLAMLSAFSGCAAFSPFGASLAGTDADHIMISGNRQTGDYRMEATGFNQSRGVERAGETLENLTRLRVYESITNTAVTQTADVADSGLEVLETSTN